MQTDANKIIDFVIGLIDEVIEPMVANSSEFVALEECIEDRDAWKDAGKPALWGDTYFNLEDEIRRRLSKSLGLDTTNGDERYTIEKEKEYIFRTTAQVLIAHGETEEEALKDAVRIMRKYGWMNICKKEE